MVLTNCFDDIAPRRSGHHVVEKEANPAKLLRLNKPNAQTVCTKQKPPACVEYDDKDKKQKRAQRKQRNVEIADVGGQSVIDIDRRSVELNSCWQFVLVRCLSQVISMAKQNGKR